MHRAGHRRINAADVNCRRKSVSLRQVRESI